MRYSLSVRGRRLLRELRAIRESRDLSPEQVAKRLGWSRSKIYRVENGESRLILEDLELLLNVYGVPSPQAEALGKLCREAWKRGWWLAYSDMYKGARTSSWKTTPQRSRSSPTTSLDCCKPLSTPTL